MNTQWDFRDSSIWDDREIQGGVGDDLKELFRFLSLCLAMLGIAMGCTL